MLFNVSMLAMFIMSIPRLALAVYLWLQCRNKRPVSFKLLSTQGALMGIHLIACVVSGLCFMGNGFSGVISIFGYQAAVTPFFYCMSLIPVNLATALALSFFPANVQLIEDRKL